MAVLFYTFLWTLLAFWATSTEARFIPDFCQRSKPWSLSDIRPEFQVYIQGKDDHATIHNETDLSNFIHKLEEQNFFSVNRKVAFLVHGYMGHMPWTKWTSEIKDAILKVEDTTVIMVVWSKGADVFYSYGESASNTQTVAAVLAQMAVGILNTNTFKGDKDSLYLHCIGHSLGAHICGQAGRAAKIFDRATGLDPAGPGFENCTDKLHIDIDSAECVDNIHTDGTRDGHWDPMANHYGTLKSWGHVDFYPNGGRDQPGCWTNDFPPCSHSMAPKLFAYTVEHGSGVCMSNGTCGDAAKIPGDCLDNVTQQMGYYSSCHASRQVIPGRFHVVTGKARPYC